METKQLKFSDIIVLSRLLNQVQNVTPLKYAVLRNKLAIEKYIAEYDESIKMYSQEYLETYGESLKLFYEEHKEEIKVSIDDYINANFAQWIANKTEFIQRLDEVLDIELYTVNIEKLENEDFDVELIVKLTKFFIINQDGK